jgi:transposase
MFNSILGIDVAKLTLEVALLMDGAYHHATFDNSRAGFKSLLKWLGKPQAGRVHACLEATGMYGEALAEFLHCAGHGVSVVNPARVKAFADSQLIRNKTDRSDARVIADFCLAQHLALWSPPDPALRELRALLRQLDDLLGMRQQERNRLKSGVSVASVVHTLRKHIAFLDREIKALDGRINNHVELHPELKRLVALLISIPGVGHKTACKLIAEIQDIQIFDSPRQLAAYAGLTPRQFVSGSSVHRKARLSKKGNTVLRTALFFPAMVAKRCNPVLRPFADRLAAAGKPPMSVTGAVMRKLLHIVFAVWKSGLPFDPCHAHQSLTLA